MPSIQEFLSLVRAKNLARTEKFQVNIFGPNIGSAVERDYLTLLCEEASIPGLTIGTRTVRLHNLNLQRPATIDYTGETATFTFLVDGSWTVREYFDKWLKTIVDTNREVAHYINIIGRIEVQALHEGNITSNLPEQNYPYEQHARYTVVLQEAFPKAISVMPMSYGNSGIQRMTVSFAFKSWVSYNSTGMPILGTSESGESWKAAQITNPDTAVSPEVDLAAIVAKGARQREQNSEQFKFGGGGGFSGGGSSGSFP